MALRLVVLRSDDPAVVLVLQVVELALISFWFYFSGGIVFKMIYSLANELTSSAAFEIFLYFKILTTVLTTVAASKQESKTIIAVIINYPQIVPEQWLNLLIRPYKICYL